MKTVLLMIGVIVLIVFIFTMFLAIMKVSNVESSLSCEEKGVVVNTHDGQKCLVLEDL